MTTNFSGAIGLLRTLAKTHSTAHGERVGFLLVDATQSLGGLAQASNALMALMAEGLVDSEPVVLGEDVHTLYRVSDEAAPTLH